MPEEDEVALVMERDGSPTLEVGVLAEERSKHASHSSAETGAKVVQDQLWFVLRGTTMTLGGGCVKRGRKLEC